MSVTINGSNTPTAGGVTYGDGTTYATTAAGTSGYLLQSNGASAPSWVAASASPITLITTTTASSTASVAFTGLTTTYKNYMVTAEHIVPATDSASLMLRTSTNNGSSYNSGATDYPSTIAVMAGSAWTIGSNTISFLYLGDISNTAGYGGISFTLNIPNPANASRTHMYANGYTNDNTFGTGAFIFGGYRNNASGAVNAIQFMFSSGNIASGTFKLYGLS